MLGADNDSLSILVLDSTFKSGKRIVALRTVHSGILSGGGVLLVAAGAVLVAVGGSEAVAAAGGLEVVDADRELAVLGRSAGNGAACLRAAANLARLAGARATRSSTAQLPSKRKHSTDDRTLRIAQSVVARFI
jgi:hypothetical protein